MRWLLEDSSAMKTAKEIKPAIAQLTLKEQISLRNWLNRQIVTGQKRQREIDELLDEVLRGPRSSISLSKILDESRR
jgi:hypothetical protein